MFDGRTPLLAATGVPVLGTALLLAGLGIVPAQPLNALLSTRPAVALGIAEGEWCYLSQAELDLLVPA